MNENEQRKVTTKRFVSGYWAHIFGVGIRDERECRFVFDRIDNKVSHLEILDGAKGWMAASEAERLDVEDSLKNANDDAIKNPYNWSLDESSTLPNWAAPKQQATDEAEEAAEMNASEMNASKAFSLRNQALAQLQEAALLDSLQPYSITHRHEYGASNYLVWASKRPSKKEAQLVLYSEFEPGKGESLEIDNGFSLEELVGVSVSHRLPEVIASQAPQDE